MRILGLILCLGLLAVPSAAKVKVAIDVSVADDRIKSELTSGLAARFNSTDRYTVTESVQTDIVLEIMCVPVKPKNANGNLAIACSSDVFYYPFKNSTLSRHLPEAGSIMTEPSEDLQRIINDFADDLINATTDEKLAEYKKSTTAGVQMVCWNEPGVCKLPLPKQ